MRFQMSVEKLFKKIIPREGTGAQRSSTGKMTPPVRCGKLQVRSATPRSTTKGTSQRKTLKNIDKSKRK